MLTMIFSRLINSKSTLLVFMTIFTAGSVYAQVEYVHLESYQNISPAYHSYEDTPFENLFREGWNSITGTWQELVVANGLKAEAFWDVARKAVEANTMPFNIANYQVTEKHTGNDVAMQLVGAAIRQIVVTYRSVTPLGDSVTLSGKIFIPKQGTLRNIIVANHYTICSNAEAPSQAFSIEGVFASKGYIVIMPDYMGYGVSVDLPHPYLNLESTVTSSIDLLLAAIPYLSYHNYNFDKPLILVGYSQGGAVTLAMQRKLEEDYADRFTIKKVYAGAGPYDLAGTYDFYAAQDTTDIPCAVPMLVQGMNYSEQLGLDMQDYFHEKLLETYETLIESKKNNMYIVNATLGKDIHKLVTPLALNKDSFPTTKLYVALQKNSIVHWTPKAPLFMFQSTQDNMVPFLNSEHVREEFMLQHLENVEYDFAPYGNHLNAAVLFFEKVYRSL